MSNADGWANGSEWDGWLPGNPRSHHVLQERIERLEGTSMNMQKLFCLDGQVADSRYTGIS